MGEYGLGLLARFPESTGLFLIIFLCSTAVIGLLYKFSISHGWLMPKVRDRDVHTTPKPRVGGVGMWLVAFIALLVMGLGDHAGLLSFGGPQFQGLDQVYWGLLGALVVILVFGLLDDLMSLPPAWQLFGQFLAATVLIIGGLEVPYIRLPLDYIIHLDSVQLWGISVWSALFTYFWLILMINVMNFFDGLDGLAGSVAMTSSLVILLVSLRFGFVGAATLCLVVFGVTAGFLPWNWHPSKLFMGSVGSQLLGLMLGVIAIISGAKLATAVLVLGIPLFDAVIVIVRRLMAHQSPFKADQRHLHHRLLKIGVPVTWVVVLINALVLIFGLAALGTQQSNTKGLLTLGLMACMGIIIFVTYLLERRAGRK